MWSKLLTVFQAPFSFPLISPPIYFPLKCYSHLIETQIWFPLLLASPRFPTILEIKNKILNTIQKTLIGPAHLILIWYLQPARVLCSHRINPSPLPQGICTCSPTPAISPSLTLLSWHPSILYISIQSSISKQDLVRPSQLGKFSLVKIFQH